MRYVSPAPQTVECCPMALEFFIGSAFLAGIISSGKSDCYEYTNLEWTT